MPERELRTEILRIDPKHIDMEKLSLAGKVIRGGGLVAFPTETVYGLGGDALSPLSSKKIYAAKGRPSDNPLIVHIADMEHLLCIAEEIPETALKTADAFWPGPLTMILKKTELVPHETTGGLDTVAVRMPVDAVAAELIRISGGYIAAPSANTSGRPSPTSAAHVIEDLSGKIDMILDAGDADIGLESTIVDLTEDVPTILRPGFITLSMLEDVLGEVRLDPGLLDAEAMKGVRPKAPGMRYRHYAPKAPLFVVEGEKSEVTRKIEDLSAGEILKGKRVGILASDDTAGQYAEALKPGCVCIRSLGNREEDRTIARSLFRVLRDFDSGEVDVIYSEAFDTPHLGMAIMNRLLKAAGHQVIEGGR